MDSAVQRRFDFKVELGYMTPGQIQKMFFMACYDIDQFRQFVFENSFLRQFDIEEQEIAQIRRNDTALYRFAMKWIEFGLLKQQGLKLKPHVMAAKKEKLGIK